MIILHLILLEFPKVSGEELIDDVEKSLEIFEAMRSVIVARRCAELTREMLGVARRYLQDRRHRQTLAIADAPAHVFGESLPVDLQDATMQTGSETWNDSFLMALLNQEGPGPERANALANLFNPTILEDLAVGPSTFAQTSSSVDTLMDFSGPTASAGGGERDGSRQPQRFMEDDTGVISNLPQQNMDLLDNGAGWT